VRSALLGHDNSLINKRDAGQRSVGDGSSYLINLLNKSFIIKVIVAVLTGSIYLNTTHLDIKKIPVNLFLVAKLIMYTE